MTIQHALPSVLSSTACGVRAILLNNPKARNAIDDEVRHALQSEMAVAAADPEVRAIVIGGVGPVFCAGGDLGSMPTDAESATRRIHELQAILRSIFDAPKPVIAAIEGHAAGSGLSYAAASDIVIAASDAKFTASFAKVGLVADVGLLWTLPRRIGRGRTSRLVLSAETADAAWAERVGLVDEIVEPGTAVETAIALATKLAAGSPLSHRAAKRLLGGEHRTIDTFLEAEVAEQVRLLATTDFVTAREAFFSKQPPRFTGR